MKNIKKILTPILHIFVWIGLLLFLETSLLPFSSNIIVPSVIHYKIASVIFICAAIYYLNYFIIIPKYLLKNKILKFSLFSVCLIIIVFFLHLKISSELDFMEHVFEIEEEYDDFDSEEDEDDEFFPTMLGIFALISSVFIVLIKKNIQEERNKGKLEFEKVSSELSLLKTQISPHFLFNTLNNIYSLIKIDPEMARDETHRLSKLLRYILYECTDEFVPLDGEMNFINNYISLMKIRFGNRVKVNFNSDINDNINFKIPPLLFIPFIENSFKHGINGVDPSEITIFFELKEKRLSLKVVNDKIKKPKTNLEAGGIGLTNVQKRLELIYNPTEYTFNINDNNDTFSILLNIPIHD